MRALVSTVYLTPTITKHWDSLSPEPAYNELTTRWNLSKLKGGFRQLRSYEKLTVAREETRQKGF